MTSELFSLYSARISTFGSKLCCRDGPGVSTYTPHASRDECCGRIGRTLPAKLCMYTNLLFCGEFMRRTSALGHQYPTDPVSRSYRYNATRSQSAEGDSDEAGSSTENTIEKSEKSHLDLLRQITVTNDTSGKTISEQLMSNFTLAEDEEFTTPLGSGQLEMEPLTISQKRNIRRQDYLNQVSRRNDTRFFTTLTLVLLLPPAVILGVAVAIGYVDLIP